MQFAQPPQKSGKRSKARRHPGRSSGTDIRDTTMQDPLSRVTHPRCDAGKGSNLALA